MFKLTGRKALVTGASGDIGEAIARALHAQGVMIGLHGTREERLKEVALDLGKDVFIFPANLSDRGAIRQLAETVEKEMNGVDILVNNAAITRDGLFVRMQDQHWDDVLTVNLTAAFTLTRELIYNMMRRRYGRIINITSIVGVVGNPGQTNYCAAKAGLIGFSKSLAQEVASRNITVNCIAPGFIKSAMTNQLNEKQKEKIISTIPMKRIGTGQEIASAAVYLASDEAGYVTGQTIHVNGGMAMI
ncbi:3-oxoacyl-[acyl-carrier-protein] reductase [Bartonella sp. AR 15-3]|uniref:3-oxoacyl-[acyl-carrier-protein] reductase n=1 Tax=Bartonella sp. AR 15-3 TaxID=545617 RepID=UPI0001F4CC22|nr:3-oxoacyl-[acyl-carrier-protein] reductase [Bartonella sp. AR 15-3]OPB31859.1 3-oxoacyl-[acyl-carrier-protein] reductase [Bartonella sp. AR 15-3]CBI79102.1 3-oxoacyl-(acyl carrierprotein) reductase [Bartonella sp. AR 15-3]